MGRKAALPAAEKTRIVLELLAGRTTLRAAAERHGVSQTAVGNWKRQFLEAARAGLESGQTVAPGHLADLLAQNTALHTALREATVQVRVWQAAARHHRDAAAQR